MSDKQLDAISKKLDTITKLLAFSLIKDKSITDQIDILTKAGIKVGDIADIVGRSENQIYVTQTTLRKKQKISKDKIEEIKKNAIRSGSVEETVYNLCQDGMTNEELAEQIKKDVPYVRAVVSSLRRKGLIKTIEKNSKKVHEQRF